VKYEIPIPHFYLDLTKDYKNRKRMFKQYVLGYIKKNYPHLTFIRIEGMNAICERRDKQ
jgi:hypothetical protein